jgi:nucleotide-binding universal stress UspA family protein
MPEQERLLVPLDGGVLAEAVLPFAAALAGATRRALDLLAVSVGGVESASRAIALRADVEAKSRADLESYLAGVARELSAAGLSASARVVHGNPAEEILAAAGAPGVWLVAMATHGRGGLERWRLGSVADKVMRLSARPALLVTPREREQAPSRQAAPLRRLLVPLDGSEPAARALAPAAELASRLGAALTLVRVEPQLPPGAAAAGYSGDIGTIDAALAREATAYLHQALAQVSGVPERRVALLRGSTVDALVGFIEREAIDLVVMTTQGRGGFNRLVFGSTADRLVRAGAAPVLLVRALPEPPADATAPAR